MADIPQLRSKEQILGDLINGFLSRAKYINDFNTGSVISQFFEAIAQSNFKAAAAIIEMIDALSVDRAVGEALQRLANDKNVPIYPARPAVGNVDITDLTFKKKQTTIYTGQPAPVAGSLEIYASNVEGWPATGSIYIGRNTINSEGPLFYTALIPQYGGAYYKIVLDATSPTTKFHNIGETIILAQGGNRTIAAGTIVQTSQGANINAVSFKTTADAIILDGETTATDIPVICMENGTAGNVPRGAIQLVVGLPFDAVAFNQKAFFSGRQADTDEDIRKRIKEYEQAKAKGTEIAIKTAAIDIIAPDELKKVQSANVIRYADRSSALVFDDGTGYEPVFRGQGYELIVDNATGGERELQLRRIPIAQARIKTVFSAPYNIPDLSYLSVTIQGKTISHQFKSSDFKVPGSATAYEVAASINGNPNLHFLANTSDGGKHVVIYPKDRLKNDIKVEIPTSGEDANKVLGFNTTIEYSLRLYKNDQPLTQDGIEAKVSTKIKSIWSASITPGDNLIYEVDKTPPINVVFQNADFQVYDAGATVSSSTSIDLWAKVFNDKMPGVKAVVNGEVIDFISNRGASDDASIRITGGTLKDKIFEPGVTIYKQGVSSDYVLNKQTGQIGLAEPLQPNDKVSAGSEFTRASVTTASIPSGPTSAGRVWMIVDGNSENIANGLVSNTKIKFQKTGTKLSIIGESQLLLPEGFDAVRPGDWVLVWGNPGDPAPLLSNQGFWRVETAETGLIVVDDGNITRTNLNTFFVPNTNRIVIARSHAPLQLLSYPISTLSSFAEFIQNNITGIDVDIVGSQIRISTQSYNDNGQIHIVAADGGADLLQLPIGKIINSIPSHFGFIETKNAEASVTTFMHSSLGTEVTDQKYVETDYLDLGGQEDEFVEILDQYDTSLITNIPDSNKKRRSLVTFYDKNTNELQMLRPIYMSTGKTPMQQGDRYFLRQSYKFDPDDFINFIIDNDAITKAFRVSIGRRLQISNHSTPTNQDFSANDLESNLDLDDQASFYDFNFNNFKVYRKALRTLTDGTYSIRVKSADFGPIGNMWSVGFIYPTDISQTSLSHEYRVNSLIEVLLRLPVGTVRTPSWDHTSCFSVQVTTVGAKDIITYQWRVGTQPDFSILTSNVSPGDIAIIKNESDFRTGNKGLSARVVSVTPTSFTIERPTGFAVNDNLVAQSIVNQSGIITVTTTTAHNLTTGQRIGLWDTASPDGFTYPFETTYIANVINPTQFSISTPGAVPGGTIAAASHAANVVTITTTNPHNLSVNNIVLISGVGGSYDGLYAVLNVINANQFQYIRSGSSPPAGPGGRFDFQTYKPTTVENISTISKTGFLVTVTIPGHGFAPGDLVSIQSVIINAWSNTTTYNPGDIVRYLGQNYVALQVTTGHQPDISPTYWAVTTRDLGGIFVVDSTTTNTFTYYYDQSGDTSGTSGTATHITPASKVARALGGSSDAYLQFAQVTATSQQVIDYISSNLANRLEAEQLGAPTDVIDRSTADLDAPANYLSGNIINLKTYKASRRLLLTADANVPAGSRIIVDGLTGGLAQYNGIYKVISTAQSGGNYLLTVISHVFAAATTNNAVSATYKGYTESLTLLDGENSIADTDLDALIGSPQFTLKYPWHYIPAIGEEIRLVAITNEQLSRFWKKFIVTGLSNVANIELSQFGDELQINSKTFGSQGSVQVSGGLANGLIAAIVGSSANLDNKLGKFEIPYAIRKGLISRQFIKLHNQIRQNKIINFDDTTVIQVFSDGIQKTAGSGTFQTLRPATHTATTQIRIEKHGEYHAVIAVSGPDFGISSAGIKEGDWVRIKNVDAPAWSPTTTYSIGQRAKYGTRNYTSLTNSNLNNQPDISPTHWRLEEFNQANQGIYQIVRTFGDDTFWIAGDNIVEEQIIIGDPNNMKFYSYDSVMPGDTLVITTNILGAVNVGRYTVVDESYGVGYSFPTATRIWTTLITSPQGPTALGQDYALVNIEEAKPLSLLKRILTVGPGSNELATILVDSPELIERITSSAGGYLVATGKLNYGTNIAFGVDSYKYYGGLIREINKVIYGDPANPTRYPGVRAAGTDIDIKPAITRRITLGLGVRVRTGVPFTTIRERIKSNVAGYVNSLGVGQAVAVSEIIKAAQEVSGVLAVAVISPTYNAANDMIPVGSDERAYVADPTTDITVSILGS